VKFVLLVERLEVLQIKLPSVPESEEQKHKKKFQNILCSKLCLKGGSHGLEVKADGS
jgi:hypothetical protein